MQGSKVLQQTDFSFLDQAEFQLKYKSSLEKSDIRFYIGGIRCGKCVRKLESLPISLPGLKQLRVDISKNLAYAEVDLGVLSFASLAEKIADLGFKPIPLFFATDEEAYQKREDRRDLIRLGVAGACAGNIMTFSFATYLGGVTYHVLFSWLSFVLYLPVVTYVAWPFYVGAWQSLRQRQLSIDLPMSVASLAGFVFSTAELVRGGADIYFDSLSGFLFLILVSRWGQKHLQRRYLNSEVMAETFRLERARRIHEGGWGTPPGWIWTPLESLKTGDQLLLLEGETLPADAELVSTNARFGMAWLSGEVKAKKFLRGSIVPAGARLDAGEAHLVIKKLLNETSFGQILQEVQKFSLTKNRTVSMADKWAQWLLAVVFICALGFLLAYWPTSHQEAIRRSLALIILACPCAMAFGTPLSLAAALRKARRKGLIVRNANVFEKARAVKTIFFDKTGTLTETDLSLVEPPTLTPEIYQKIILSLENESVHPIAFSFRKAFATPKSLLTVENLREILGKGVSGYIFGRLYEILSDLTLGSQIRCTLFEDKQPLFKFTFAAQTKPDCLAVLNELRTRGHRVALISGDKKEVTEIFGARLGFAPQDIFSEMNPTKKALIVSQTPNSMMIGDGVNDSLAMMKASVSVASSGGVEAALRSSDVYLTEASLKGVVTLLDVSHESIGLIRQNLLISVIYNICGGTLALLGYVNPMVAAVLMPLSSGFILFSTWMKGHK